MRKKFYIPFSSIDELNEHIALYENTIVIASTEGEALLEKLSADHRFVIDDILVVIDFDFFTCEILVHRCLHATSNYSIKHVKGVN